MFCFVLAMAWDAVSGGKRKESEWVASKELMLQETRGRGKGKPKPPTLLRGVLKSNSKEQVPEAGTGASHAIKIAAMTNNQKKRERRKNRLS